MTWYKYLDDLEKFTIFVNENGTYDYIEYYKESHPDGSHIMDSREFLRDYVGLDGSIGASIVGFEILSDMNELNE